MYVYIHVCVSYTSMHVYIYIDLCIHKCICIHMRTFVCGIHHRISVFVICTHIIYIYVCHMHTYGMLVLRQCSYEHCRNCSYEHCRNTSVHMNCIYDVWYTRIWCISYITHHMCIYRTHMCNVLHMHTCGMSVMESVQVICKYMMYITHHTWYVHTSHFICAMYIICTHMACVCVWMCVNHMHTNITLNMCDVYYMHQYGMCVCVSVCKS